MADISGINRIRNVFGAGLGFLSLNRNGDASADRDAQGGGGQKRQPKDFHLNPEQELEAVKKLCELPSFKSAGFSARIVRGAGVAPHIEVLSPNGSVVRKLPYEQIVEIYLSAKNQEGSSGYLLKKTA